MPVSATNSDLASVNKSFVSQHKKELLLVAGLVASVALGLFVSPDLGVGVGALTFFMYLSAKLLSPPSIAENKLTHKKCQAWDQWDVNSAKRASSVAVSPKGQGYDSGFDKMAAEWNARPDVKKILKQDQKRAQKQAEREAARAKAKVASSTGHLTRYAN